MDLQLVWYQDGYLRQFSFRWTSGIPRSEYVRICKEYFAKETKTKLLRANARQSKMTNKSSDNQNNIYLFHTSTSFCLTEGHVNCQGAITRPTTHRSMTSSRTQYHRTSDKRNMEHQSHECLQSLLTHSTTLAGPPSSETPQYVTLF